MKTLKKTLAMLLALCMMLTFVPTAQAAPPTSMTIADLAKVSGGVASTMEYLLTSGTEENGVYNNVIVPTHINVGSYTMGVEDYVLMAAQAVWAISDGAATTTIAYKDITLDERMAEGTALTTLATGQIADLARRATRYGVSMGYLPTSFNRPSGSTETYEGRICIYSLAHILALSLATYSTDSTLPITLTFIPSGYTTTEVCEPTEPPVTEPAPTSPVTGVYGEVVAAAQQIKAYVEEKAILPDSVVINGNTCTMAEAEDLMLQVIVNINNGSTTTALTYIDLADAGNPSEEIVSGSIGLTEYIDMAGRNLNWNRANPASANYTTTSLGRIHYCERVYFNASILDYYATNAVLPDTMKAGSWYTRIGEILGSNGGTATFGNDFSAYSAYLVPTANCQSTNATLIAAALTAMYCPASKSHSGKVYTNPTSTYEAMWNVMEYITYVTTYQGYSNTSKGALGTWNAKAGNCCDMAHLMCALARSLGVPARYQHWWCQFTGGQDGHVFAGLYIPDAPSGTKGNDGNWFYADPVNNSCRLGYQTFKLLYTCSGNNTIELPF